MPHLSSASGRRPPLASAVAILVLSVLLLGLAACGGKDDPVPEPAAPPADAEPVAPAPTPFVVMESPPVPVGTTVAEPPRGALPALEITAAKPTAVPAPIAPQPVPPTAVVLEAVPSATPVVAVAPPPTVVPLAAQKPAPVPTADPQEPAAAEEQGSIASVDGELTLERVLERNQEAMSKVTSFRFKIRVLTNGIYCEDSQYPGFLYVEGHYVAPHQLYARITERDNVVAEWEPGMDAVVTDEAVYVRYYWRDLDGGLGGDAKHADWERTALDPKNRRIGEQFNDPTLSLEDIFYSLPWTLPAPALAGVEIDQMSRGEHREWNVPSGVSDEEMFTIDIPGPGFNNPVLEWDLFFQGSSHHIRLDNFLTEWIELVHWAEKAWIDIDLYDFNEPLTIEVPEEFVSK